MSPDSLLESKSCIARRPYRRSVLPIIRPLTLRTYVVLHDVARSVEHVYSSQLVRTHAKLRQGPCVIRYTVLG